MKAFQRIGALSSIQLPSSGSINEIHMLFHSLIGHTVETDCNFSVVNAGCHHISVSQTADPVYVRAP